MGTGESMEPEINLQRKKNVCECQANEYKSSLREDDSVIVMKWSFYKTQEPDAKPIRSKNIY